MKIQESALKEHIQQVRAEVMDKEKALRELGEQIIFKTNLA